PGDALDIGEDAIALLLPQRIDGILEKSAVVHDLPEAFLHRPGRMPRKLAGKRNLEPCAPPGNRSIRRAGGAAGSDWRNRARHRSFSFRRGRGWFMVLPSC